MKKINELIKQKAVKILLPFFCVATLFSCDQAKEDPFLNKKGELQAATIMVDYDDKNVLAILLAKDGTINRKGTADRDTTEKDFFMGITQDKIFDSLINTINADLSAHIGKKVENAADKTKPICKVTISFSGKNMETGMEYSTNGTFNEIPEPIKDYISDAIRLTEPWYQTQKKMISK